MSESVELWLVRHGETAWSLSGAHTGSTDIPLTQHGRVRAEELRDYISAASPSPASSPAPWSAPVRPAASPALKHRPPSKRGLREWDYGEAEGRTTAEMREKYGPQWSVWTSDILGGETLEHVGQRADDVIERALAGVAPAR